MTVRELKERLENCDQDQNVYMCSDWNEQYEIDRMFEMKEENDMFVLLVHS